MQTKSGFHDKLDRRMAEAETLVCVGLDPQVRLLPKSVTPDRAGITEFLTSLIEATAPYTAVYKPNLAFYTALGLDGLHLLAEVCAAVPDNIPVLLDCKVGDVGDTARAYATSWFDVLGVDACTVNPYLGEDTLAPFFSYAGKGVIVICKTSNSGSGDLQDQELAAGKSVYQQVADRCAEWNATYPASIGVVVGATYPQQLADVRQRVGDQPILLPGLGAQGGDVEAAVGTGLDSKGRGLMCSASRSILYAGSDEDYAERGAEAAMMLRDQINSTRAAVQLASHSR
jgi:orotidine-5'-phosphate decarboxylase